MEEENNNGLYKATQKNSKRPLDHPKTYRYQKTMDDLNDMMVRIKVNLYDTEELNKLKEIYPKPTVEELDMFTANLFSILQEINESQVKF